MRLFRPLQAPPLPSQMSSPVSPTSPTFTNFSAPSPYSSASSVDDAPFDTVPNDRERDSAVVQTMSSYSPFSSNAQPPLYQNQNDLVYPDQDQYYQSMMPWTSPVAKKQQGMQGQYHSQHQQQQIPAQQLSVFIPNGQQQQHSPVTHSPVPHHHSQQSHHSQQQSHLLDNIDLEEWHSQQHQYSHAQSHSLAMAQVHPNHSYPRVKQEDLSAMYPLNGNGTYGHGQAQQQTSSHSQGHIFDLSTHHQLQAQPSSSSYNLLNTYYQSQGQHSALGMHERFVHPSELSPADSPVSPLEFPQRPDDAADPAQGQTGQTLHPQMAVGCDPRYVSGDLGAANTGRDDANEADAEGDDDVDAEGEDEYEEKDVAAGKDDDAYEDDDDYEDADYDDDRDGEYVLRRGRRPSGGSTKRSLRTRPGAERYNPYQYASPSPSAYPDTQNQIGISTRSRRTTSNDSSFTSTASSLDYPLSSHRRRPRPSTNLPVPVPVPNLTKKSRGRRVPTVATLDISPRRSGDGDFHTASGKGARVHLCQVPGCGKCFARGEHLKRHVRSIHTYDKPHKCPYPGCGKDFSRHDNLGQHMRVHKDYRG